jgi:hypothetical protein
VFATVIYPCLIFAGKARSLPLEWSPFSGSTLVASSLVCIYKTKVEVNDSGKKPNFYNAAAITVVKSFIVQALVLKNILWSYIFDVQLARNYQRKFLALLKSVRLGLERLTVTNTLAS